MLLPVSVRYCGVKWATGLSHYEAASRTQFLFVPPLNGVSPRRELGTKSAPFLHFGVLWPILSHPPSLPPGPRKAHSQCLCSSAKKHFEAPSAVR